MQCFVQVQDFRLEVVPRPKCHMHSQICTNFFLKKLTPEDSAKGETDCEIFICSVLSSIYSFEALVSL